MATSQLVNNISFIVLATLFLWQDDPTNLAE